MMLFLPKLESFSKFLHVLGNLGSIFDHRVKMLMLDAEEDEDDLTEVRKTLVDLIWAIEQLACFNFGRLAFRFDLLRLKRQVKAIEVIRLMLETDVLFSELQAITPDLLGSYNSHINEARIRLKQLQAVLKAAISNMDGEARGETQAERLDRAFISANDCKPIRYKPVNDD